METKDIIYLGVFVVTSVGAIWSIISNCKTRKLTRELEDKNREFQKEIIQQNQEFQNGLKRLESSLKFIENRRTKLSELNIETTIVMWKKLLITAAKIQDILYFEEKKYNLKDMPDIALQNILKYLDIPIIELENIRKSDNDIVFFNNLLVRYESLKFNSLLTDYKENFVFSKFYLSSELRKLFSITVIDLPIYQDNFLHEILIGDINRTIYNFSNIRSEYDSNFVKIINIIENQINEELKF